MSMTVIATCKLSLKSMDSVNLGLLTRTTSFREHVDDSQQMYQKKSNLLALQDVTIFVYNLLFTAPKWTGLH